MEENIEEKGKKHLFKKKDKDSSATAVGAPRKKKKKVWLIVLLIVAIIIGAIGFSVSRMTAQMETIANLIEIEPVEKRDLSDSVSLKGTIAGQSKTNVMSFAAAEVTSVSVQVGDIVKAGDPLVTLDQEDIERQIAELKTSINNANALAANDAQQKRQSLDQNVQDQNDSLTAAQKVIDEAQSNVDKYKKKVAECADYIAYLKSKNEDTSVYDQKLEAWKASLEESQKALETAKDNYNTTVKTTDRQVASAQNTVDMQKYQASTTTDAKNQLEQLEKQLADCVLSAPIGGVVTAVNVSVGDKYTAGSTMITIEDTSSLKMIANVDEADILKIQEGMNATVTTDATGDELIKGTVTRVVRVKNQTSANTTDTNTVAGYSAEITIENTELLVGMSAKAKIIIEDRGTKLAVPYDLIQYDENGNAFVLVAETGDDGMAVAVRKNVTVGEEVDYYTEITGGDLKEGDQLIYDYTFSVMEGQSFLPEQMYSNQAMNLDGAAGADDAVITEAE